MFLFVFFRACEIFWHWKFHLRFDEIWTFNRFILFMIRNFFYKFIISFIFHLVLPILFRVCHFFSFNFWILCLFFYFLGFVKFFDIKNFIWYLMNFERLKLICLVYDKNLLMWYKYFFFFGNMLIETSFFFVFLFYILAMIFFSFDI